MKPIRALGVVIKPLLNGFPCNCDIAKNKSAALAGNPILTLSGIK